MTKSEIFERIFNSGVVPAVCLEEAGDASPLAQALLAAGVDVISLSFKTEAAERIVQNLTGAGILVGAGAVLDVETVKQAVSAGASFIMTPGFNHNVVKYCVDNDICVIPGVSCPTDIEAGLAYGLSVVTFFPAETNGGPAALEAFSAPYGGLKFIPAGGISKENIASYLALDCVLACGDDRIARDDLIKAKDFTEITRLAKETVAAVHGFTFAHLGINSPDEASAGAVADAFTSLFGFPQKDIGISIFSTNSIEIMKSKGHGDFGHIGIRCVNLHRAIAYLKSKEIETDPETILQRGGRPVLIYLKEPIGSFMVHIVQ